MERRSKDVETPLWKICKLENEFVRRGILSPEEMLVEMSPCEMVVLALQEFSQQILQRPQIGIVCLRISSNCNVFHRLVTFITGGLHPIQ